MEADGTGLTRAAGGFKLALLCRCQAAAGAAESMSDGKQELLRTLPSITELLKHDTVGEWLRRRPAPLVTDCLRRTLAGFRQEILDGKSGGEGLSHVTVEAVLVRAGGLLEATAEPQVREAINASGIILHTGLGRAAFPGVVVDAIGSALRGYVNLAVDRDSGERIERDELVEPLLCELTGAEAATVVNNNAGATLLVLAALAAQREVIVSRGQLIEIGGSFRLPDVMQQSQARLVEVGTTNRTHLKDYRNAMTDNTAALMRVQPSNYRIVGFTKEVGLAQLAELAHSRGLTLIDDLGAGALLDLRQFGLLHEPTVRESIDAGADVVLFSGDKLIGAAQAGIIVGRKDVIARIRKHPLMRALRVDKTCIMVLERTLQMFRDPEHLKREHPTYRMITTSLEVLEQRAGMLARAIAEKAPRAGTEVRESRAYVGSGSLPEESIPSFVVRVDLPGLNASELARRLRLDPACVFGRIESERVCFDVRTINDDQAKAIAEAVGRIAG